MMSGSGAALLLIGLAVSQPPATGPYFQIQVTDALTGRGVPLVELRTVNDIPYFTDSAGRVAFYEPGLMDQEVFFHVSSHGYEFPADGFGYRGRKLRVTEGGRATLKIRRVNIAERLYRVTGGGIYRDTRLLGLPAPLQQPVLNARVLGSDSVVSALYNDRIHWFWGDTNRPSYPLGNFHVPGATSRLPSQGGLPPEKGVDLEYLERPDGFARPTAQLPGQGPTWINGLVVLDDSAGRQRMFASYVKVEPPLKVYERGMAEFSDATQSFEKRRQFELDAPARPGGHPLRHSEGGGEAYVYFPDPFPLVRVRATVDSLLDPSQYEAYSCFEAGSRQDNLRLDRGPDGKLRFGWKTNTLPLTQSLERQLVEDGHLAEGDRLLDVRDVVSGKPVQIHGGSVNWNAFRQRWILIAVESFGSSALGEVWYAEAASLVGPWSRARKIVTHDKYSFYNPKQHPLFDQQGGRIIYFEGTYTNMFSGNPDRTPRYNYNQVMYRLDLGCAELSGVHE